MKQPEWLGNTISIGLFAVLAAASWGLNQVLQRARLDSAAVKGEGPNAIIENPRITRSNPQGQALYRLDAARITFNEQADRSVIERPVMVSLDTSRPKTVMQADQAVTTRQQNQVDLEGNVRIQRDPFDGQPAAKITTSRATVLVREEQATTDAPVLVERGLSTLQGVGMRFDQKTQRIEIVSESRMVVPKERRP